MTEGGAWQWGFTVTGRFGFNPEYSMGKQEFIAWSRVESEDGKFLKGNIGSEGAFWLNQS